MSKQLIFLSYDPDKDGWSNPQVKCPECGHVSGVMNDFNLLEHGMNGIEEGSEDDCGLQECGHCEGRFDDAEVWRKVDEIHNEGGPG